LVHPDDIHQIQVKLSSTFSMFQSLSFDLTFLSLAIKILSLVI